MSRNSKLYEDRKFRHQVFLRIKIDLEMQLKLINDKIRYFENDIPDNWHVPEYCEDCECEFIGINCCDHPSDYWDKSLKDWKNEVEHEQRG